MAEAVAGLSLAANILQMVEYGVVFVTTAWKIHSEQTDSDVVKDFNHLQGLAKDVDKVLDSLPQDASAESSTSTSPGTGDLELARLAEECRQVTKEIMEFVSDTADRTSWMTRTQKTVKKAFQMTWGRGKLTKLQTRLDSMRSQLNLRLVHSLRNFAEASSERQELVLGRILEEMGEHNHKVDQVLGIGLGTAYVGFIARKLNERLGERLNVDIIESLKLDILGLISEPGQAFEGNGSPEPRTVQVSPGRRQTMKQRLLENLSYSDMAFRENSVVTASETTFQWIFEREKQADRPWASFCEWLEVPDKQLYWITGKPGSGKSTLMKFISQPPADVVNIYREHPANSPRCLSFLKRWAGSQPLIIASYYFWAIGSPMQRSKEGMLRSLLHSLLHQVDPEVIATMMPLTWEALYLFDEDLQLYTEDSLKKLLSSAFGCICPSTKICLFIDGLDEFEGQHESLVLYLRDSLKAYPIKLCVSSRQWQVFEDAFHDTPSLRLQDLTLPDMMEYVRSELYVGPAFAQLRERDPDFCDKLNEDVALRANGVFLWLTLVVKSLRKGITAGDRISDLQVRLDQLPQDLEALFERILDELDTEYLDHAIRYFRLMEARREIGLPNIMVFSYADEEDEMFGINCPVSPLEWKTFEGRRDYLKRRLNSHCMGLLEISTESEQGSILGRNAFLHASASRVNYLHRTFGEYIARDEVRERLNRSGGRGFDLYDDPHLRLCSAELAFYKSSPSAYRQGSLDHQHRPPSENLTSPSINCLRHAAQVQERGSQSMLRLLEALENFFPVDTKSYNFEPAGIAYEGRGWGTLALRGSMGPPLIRHAIEWGVVEYMRVKLEAHRQFPVRKLKLWRKIPSTRKTHTWLSRRDLDPDGWSEIDWQLAVAVLSERPIPAIVEILLGKGADFQYVDSGEKLSVWKLALVVYMFEWRAKLPEREKREQVVALMIKYGAPIETHIIRNAYVELVARLQSNVGVEEVITVKREDIAFCSTIENKLKAIKQGVR
ncbi:hypothetical protein KVR01_004660 [Diaporthe batatas]|uniref:uncharacterized protein n=1 Tax=Diaporthe batatas TaxID=748121 RepID=UPI001D04FFE4|nr:uncharacterized protein KVR01_004660 [Diaporthe batatas]KAG8166108.1 hypothetical protein KVR01_004660 [Diaporthe batatas]